ncbi:MAG: hypothetical protein ACE5HX_09205 [bacterium]
MFAQTFINKHKDFGLATIFILIGIFLQLNENEVLSSRELQNFWPFVNDCVQKLVEAIESLFSLFIN